MPRISRFILIDAPQEQVFACITDYKTLLKIQPQFKTIRSLGEPERGLGARIEAQGSMHGLPLSATMTIVEFEPPTLMVSDSRGGVDSRSIWRFSTVEDDNGVARTRAALAIEYEINNPAFALIGKLIQRELEQMTQQSLRLLKQLVEQGGL